MNVSYEVFYPEILPYFPGIPEPVAFNAVRNACIEFCDRTDWLMYTPILQDVIDGQSEYDMTLDTPTDTTVARVQSAWYTDLPLLARGDDDLRRIYNLNWRDQTGRPVYYTQYDPETLILCPTPDQTVPQSLAVTLIIRPLRDSTTVDSSLHERWVEVIAAGARSRLHEAAGHAYENPQMADKFRALFTLGINKAISERTRGLSRSTMRVRPPRLV